MVEYLESNIERSALPRVVRVHRSKGSHDLYWTIEVEYSNGSVGYRYGQTDEDYEEIVRHIFGPKDVNDTLYAYPCRHVFRVPAWRRPNEDGHERELPRVKLSEADLEIYMADLAGDKGRANILRRVASYRENA